MSNLDGDIFKRRPRVLTPPPPGSPGIRVAARPLPNLFVRANARAPNIQPPINFTGLTRGFEAIAGLVRQAREDRHVDTGNLQLLQSMGVSEEKLDEISRGETFAEDALAGEPLSTTDTGSILPGNEGDPDPRPAELQSVRQKVADAAKEGRISTGENPLLQEQSGETRGLIKAQQIVDSMMKRFPQFGTFEPGEDTDSLTGGTVITQQQALQQALEEVNVPDWMRPGSDTYDRVAATKAWAVVYDRYQQASQQARESVDEGRRRYFTDVLIPQRIGLVAESAVEAIDNLRAMPPSVFNTPEAMAVKIEQMQGELSERISNTIEQMVYKTGIVKKGERESDFVVAAMLAPLNKVLADPDMDPLDKADQVRTMVELFGGVRLGKVKAREDNSWVQGFETQALNKVSALERQANEGLGAAGTRGLNRNMTRLLGKFYEQADQIPTDDDPDNAAQFEKLLSDFGEQMSDRDGIRQILGQRRPVTAEQQRQLFNTAREHAEAYIRNRSESFPTEASRGQEILRILHSEGVDAAAAALREAERGGIVNQLGPVARGIQAQIDSFEDIREFTGPGSAQQAATQGIDSLIQGLLTPPREGAEQRFAMGPAASREMLQILQDARLDFVAGYADEARKAKLEEDSDAAVEARLRTYVREHRADLEPAMQRWEQLSGQRQDIRDKIETATLEYRSVTPETVEQVQRLWGRAAARELVSANRARTQELHRVPGTALQVAEGQIRAAVRAAYASNEALRGIADVNSTEGQARIGLITAEQIGELTGHLRAVRRRITQTGDLNAPLTLEDEVLAKTREILTTLSSPIDENSPIVQVAKEDLFERVKQSAAGVHASLSAGTEGKVRDGFAELQNQLPTSALEFGLGDVLEASQDLAIHRLVRGDENRPLLPGAQRPPGLPAGASDADGPRDRLRFRRNEAATAAMNRLEATPRDKPDRDSIALSIRRLSGSISVGEILGGKIQTPGQVGETIDFANVREQIDPLTTLFFNPQISEKQFAGEIEALANDRKKLSEFMKKVGYPLDLSTQPPPNQGKLVKPLLGTTAPDGRRIEGQLDLFIRRQKQLRRIH